MELKEGSIDCPKGFRATGIAAGLKPDGKDIALIMSDHPAAAAGMFTTNLVQAAPILLNREHLRDGRARAIVANSKNANACTGEAGLADARRTAQVAAAGLGLSAEDVLVNSTGVIGVRLPMDTIEAGVRTAASQLGPEGWDAAAEAIMTTDTVPKKATVALSSGAVLCGIAKGSGMIAPNMATMLCFLATDAGLEPDQLGACLREAVGQSFNCVTVDGDMSTNDTVLLLANGQAGSLNPGDPGLDEFQEGLNALCLSLARQIARDGEGATKLISIRVTGAESESQAQAVGLSVANSNLVKTAVFGRDPNWGRILCAIGYAGVAISPDRVTVSMAGIPIYGSGGGIDFDKEEAIQSLAAEEIPIDIDLGDGKAQAQIYTCDLTYDYIRINAEYTT